MRFSLHPGVWTNGLSLSLAGAGGVTVATATQPTLLYLGWAGIAAGVSLFVWGIRVDERPWWQLWRKPILYVSHVRERLPDEGPAYPFFLYSILEAYPSDAIYYGWSEHSGKIPWGWPERPWAQRIEVTNHSDDILVNVIVQVALKAIITPGQPPVRDAQVGVRLNQVRSGETALAFIVNDSPHSVNGYVVSAAGTPIGRKQRDLKFHTKADPRIMWLPPADRHLPDYKPVTPAATALSPRHKEILQSLATPLARVYDLSMAYGERDLAGIAAAKSEAQGLVAEIPYDQASSQTVRDFINYCDRLIGDWMDHADERGNRDLVHRVSSGLFRFLHEGRPVDRSEIQLAEDEQ